MFQAVVTALHSTLDDLSQMPKMSILAGSQFFEVGPPPSLSPLRPVPSFYPVLPFNR